MEKHPGVTPRIISDIGPQFIAKDFKEFIRTYNQIHFRTSPYYPQSNGKLGRGHGSIKQECIRITCTATMEEAEKRATSYVQHYNHTRLLSAIGYIMPADCQVGLGQVIGQERHRKLDETRQRRLEKRLSKNWLPAQTEEQLPNNLRGELHRCCRHRHYVALDACWGIS